jgi:hypothetical protein
MLLKMRNAEALHGQIHNTQEALAQDEALPIVSSLLFPTGTKSRGAYRSEHDQRRVLPPHDRPPPPAEQTPDRSCQSKGGNIVHADGDGNPARNQRVPAFPGRLGFHGGGDGKEDGSPECPFLGHGWKPLAGHQAGGEDPYVACGDLEEVAWYLVDAETKLALYA